MRNISRVLRLWCLVLIMVLLAAGCKARPPVTVKKEIGVTLRRPEIMLVVATERNRDLGYCRSGGRDNLSGISSGTD